MFEQHVAALHAHLWRAPRGKVLHMHRGRDHRTGDAQALGHVPLHLRAQHQVGPGLGDGGFHGQVVVGDQGLQAVVLRGLAHGPGLLAAVAAQADQREAHFLHRHPGSGDGMGGIAEHKHPLAVQVVGVHRGGIPARAPIQPGQRGRRVHARQRGHLFDESDGGLPADGHDRGAWLLPGALQPVGRGAGHLGVEHDVEVGLGQAGQVGRAGTQGRGHVGVDAQLAQQALHLRHVVAVAKAQGRGAQQVAPGPAVGGLGRTRCGGLAGGVVRPGAAPVGRRSRPRPSFPCAGRPAAPGGSRAPTGRARPRGHRGRPGSARRLQDAPTTRAWGWKRSQASRAARWNRPAVSPPRSRAWKVL